MSGVRHRRKGDRIEREVVDRHKALGVHAERYPLSGASRFRGSGHDIDLYVFGREAAPLVAEVKSRRDGAGFTTLERWLGEYDALFLRRDNTDPLVLLPWRMWARIVEQVMNLASKIDFAALMEPVALRLLGEPNSQLSKPPRELRFGTHGSVSVDLLSGTFFDHENNIGGGVIDLVSHRLGCDHAAAVSWLRSQGFLDGVRRAPAPRPTSAPRPAPASKPALTVVTEPPKIVAEYDYRDEKGAPLFQVVRYRPKGFRQRKRADNGEWVWRLGDVRRVMYRLPEIIAAVAADRTIYIVEGEKDADNLARLGLAATTCPGGAKKWEPEYTEFLRGADVVILGDNDEPGRKHVEQVVNSLNGIARRVRILDLAKVWPECPEGGDVSKWLEAGGGTGDKLAALVSALPPAPSVTCASEIERLAKLSPLEYDRERKDSADKLGIRVAALDAAVRQHKAQAQDEATALPHWKVEPWHEPVNGAASLNDIKRVILRHVVLPKGAADAIALWVLHTWTADAGDISPFLVLTSPTKRCGKTTLLIILFYLTTRSELASNISPSAIFRYIEDIRPTLLLDEADSFVKDNEEMRGILNSGHTKAAAYVIRNVEINGEHKPRRFSTWAPKAVATIGALADTLEDRSIKVVLQRKPKGGKVTRLRRRDSEEFGTLRRKAARWAADNFTKLESDPEPTIPDDLNDRAADNWRPLLAIAEIAGEEWARQGREAACLLSGDGHDTAANVELLCDIKVAFGSADAIRSADLVAKLGADPERPWAEWNRGKPLTQKQLANLLRPFEIASETVHIEGLPHAKGYKRARFEEAWAAYPPGKVAGPNDAASPIPPSEACKRANADEIRTSSDFSKRANYFPHGSKNSELSNSHAGLHACTDRKPETGSETDLAKPERHVATPGDGSAAESVTVANSFAISATPEDRKPPEPGRLTAGVANPRLATNEGIDL